MLRDDRRNSHDLCETLRSLGGSHPDTTLEDLARLAPPRQNPEDGDGIPWHRWQDPVIEDLVPYRGTILDLGCGDGTLLERLIRRRNACAQGVELNEEAVLRCIERGVPVFHGNLDEGLHGFPDKSFDIVILEETLQVLRHPTTVLEEMLRVGRQGVVSFPNFAHWRVRRAIAETGRMPITDTLPHTWYDTPNIHLCSIRDFVDWTVTAGVSVLNAFVLVDGVSRPLRQGDNLRATEALFVLKKDGDNTSCATPNQTT